MKKYFFIFIFFLIISLQNKAFSYDCKLDKIKMSKKALTAKEQIVVLKKRGMTFDCGEIKAEEILLDIGYYWLGFYWLH